MSCRRLWLCTTNRSPSGEKVHLRRVLAPKVSLLLSHCTLLLTCRSVDTFTRTRLASESGGAPTTVQGLERVAAKS
jgi:hypothetical protein